MGPHFIVKQYFDSYIYIYASTSITAKDPFDLPCLILSFDRKSCQNPASNILRTKCALQTNHNNSWGEVIQYGSIRFITSMEYTMKLFCKYTRFIQYSHCLALFEKLLYQGLYMKSAHFDIAILCHSKLLLSMFIWICI